MAVGEITASVTSGLLISKNTFDPGWASKTIEKVVGESVSLRSILVGLIVMVLSGSITKPAGGREKVLH